MVGTRGFEPLTSSVSRKRSPTELRAYGVNKIIFYNPPCQSHDRTISFRRVEVNLATSCVWFLI